MGLLTGKTDPTQIPTSGSSSATWVEWHKTLVDNFGKKEANQLWLKAWNLRGSTSTSDNTLREYMKKQGISLPATWGQKIDDAGVGVLDSALGMMHMGRVMGLIVAGVVLVPVALLLFNIARKPESIGTIVKAAAV